MNSPMTVFLFDLAADPRRPGLVYWRQSGSAIRPSVNDKYRGADVLAQK
jgi:hypothetical protein